MQILPSLTPCFLSFVLVELQQHQTHSHIFFSLVISFFSELVLEMIVSELGVPLTEKLVVEMLVS
jgi:hypothetical protein